MPTRLHLRLCPLTHSPDGLGDGHDLVVGAEVLEAVQLGHHERDQRPVPAVHQAAEEHPYDASNREKVGSYDRYEWTIRQATGNALYRIVTSKSASQ